jgi:hypothetical protein
MSSRSTPLWLLNSATFFLGLLKRKPSKITNHSFSSRISKSLSFDNKSTFVGSFILFIVVSFGLNSCTLTQSVKYIQLEVFKPAILNIPSGQTVAVIKRDLFHSDTSAFYYFDGYKHFYHFDGNKKTTEKKSTYNSLSDICTIELANYLEESGKFKKVNNYTDSVNYKFADPELIENRDEWFEITKSDICIFLDYFHLKTRFDMYNSIPFETKASFIWIIALKNDSLNYRCIQKDTLFYTQEQMLDYGTEPERILNNFLNNSCKYLGKSFSTRVIPSWIQTERMYYKSMNPDMVKAEKFAKNLEWTKAAEIWNTETKNKNNKIACKAMFNMALACEIEGKPDLAIGWLTKSHLELKHPDEIHKAYCQRYVNILALRKHELARLESQIESTNP